MLRYLLSSRWVQSGLAFFVLVVGGILIHSWHVLRSTETRLEQNSRFSQGLEKHKETSVAQEVMAPADTGVPGFVNPPDENTAPPISSEKEALPKETEPLDSAGVFLPDKTVSEESPTKEIPVSPYGFGPYPELPDGWPDTTFPAPSADHELQQRVRIKLISQGVPVEGTFMENGLVYPVIKGIVYVKWKSYWRPTGKVTYISRIGGHPDDTMPIEMIRREKGRSFTKKDIPSDIKLRSFGEDGIDPYRFLELP